MDTIITLIVAILGSSALSGLVIFLITRHDQKKNFGGRLDELEKGVLRTQLLLMISLKPDEKSEILTIGEHYFRKKEDGGLEGNWYMTPIFNKWCEEKKLSPSWFNR